MTSRMPKFLDRRKICIICEGAEEYEYLERLNTLNVWNEQYKVILDNADGNGNIPARYQDRYQNSSYDLVLVFCDTEKKPYEQYVDIKRKINEFHGVDNVADSVIIYGNPCTMQIILQHWCEEKLKTPSKKVNSSLIQQCTGVENYKGRADQRKQIMEQITLENFGEMKERIKQMENDDRIIGSSNFARFIEFLTNEDDGWIEKINTLLDV
ncbi:hypothetical protein [Eubacterium ventriosum]|uniref:hypothetical protein n=1 Tax=Eubacterium ventriosum TaxID=39496 RepID=UPI000E4A76E3|nr:hypothetical protein [Eubacterium ventriosum]RHD11650.1 hypothetical protein DW809_10350 [Eubacterium ventriosum]